MYRMHETECSNIFVEPVAKYGVKYYCSGRTMNPTLIATISDKTQTVFRCASEILGWKDVHDPQIVQKPQSYSSGL